MNYRIIWLSLFAFSFLLGCRGVKNTKETVKKIETVTICNQVWMKNNLDVDHYRNGDSIPEAKDPTEWSNLTTGAWCFYDNDPAMGDIYGKLYNWFAVNDPLGLAPEGWHVASDEEWTVLAACLGGKNIAGGKLKEAGTAYWQSPNKGATNESGFSALPGGTCGSHTGTSDSKGTLGTWWTSTQDTSSYSWASYMLYHYSSVGRSHYVQPFGFSVRCVKN